MMKNIIFTTIVAISIALCTYGQQPPTTGNSNLEKTPTTGNSNINNQNAWSRAGNSQLNGGNIFGTRWNSPVYFYTGGGLPQRRRAKLNATFTGINQYPINGYSGIQGVNTTGYLLLGRNNTSISDGQNIYTEKGAFSMLHLNGPGSEYQEYGYRPWMKTGVTLTGNRDLSYFGLRKLSTNAGQEDKTETVFLWSDNTDNASGPDKLVFRFSGFGGNDKNSVSGNRLSNTDLDGLHVAQFTGKGFMGLGNTFGTDATGMNAANYVDPQSLLHSSYDHRNGSANEGYGFHQITYRRDNTNTVGTGETAQDGLRWGIDNTVRSAGGTQYLNGNIRWQENSPLVFQTDWNNTPGGINNGERLRIATVASPGVPNTGGYAANTTRVAISVDGADPITQPRSLLHLGRNTGANSFPLVSEDGYRDWMNIGAFMSDGTDNVYVGLKKEDDDRTDAVLNWGDNQAPGATNAGPDNLRFIFTSTTTAFTGQGDPVSQSGDGLETGRFDPTEDVNGLPDSYGKLGVGDFYTTPTPVTHKLHVRGNGRFEYIPEEEAEHIILGKEVDPSNPDDVSFRRLAFTDDPNDVLLGDGTWGTVNVTGADDQNLTNATLNGTTLTIEIEDGNPVSVDLSDLQDGIGTDDQNLTGATLTGSILTIDIENGNSVSVDLTTLQDGTGTDDQNLTNATLIGSILTIDIENGNSVSVDLSDLVTTSNALAHNGTSRSTIDPEYVSFGQDIGDPTNPGALLSNREVPMDGYNIEFNGIGVDDGNLVSFGQPNTVTGYEEAKVHVYNDQENAALTGYTDASNLQPFFTRQFGISGYITNAESDISAAVHGLAENSATGMQGTGVFGEAQGNTQNIGVRGTIFDDNSDINYGGSFGAFGQSDYNYGVFCNASGATIQDYAGYFGGDVYIGGATSGPSDQDLKDNVAPIQDATEIINLLNPVSFDFKQNGQYERLNLDDDNQFGLIAQDVELILPELITDIAAPAVYDSLGNEIYPAMTFKGLDYEAFIPILTKGMQEQNSTIDSLQNELAQKDSLINDINGRLTQLENCLSNLLPTLCQINNSAIQENDEETQEALLHQINVELFDGENIILEQNIPNPFAERTVINYQIPASVGDAKLLFYNNQGRMIREVKIAERGAGQVNVFGSELSKGTYSYTLICDGEVISTKKMVKQ